jgi:uncharacterized protein (DUF302 family)
MQPIGGRIADTLVLMTVPSSDGVRETMDRLVASLERRGLEIFARIDHAANARRVGLELADEELLIFGDPRVGTLLMQSDPAIGYELPLRMLVREEPAATTIAFRPVRKLAGAYGVADRAEVLDRIDVLLGELAAEAGTPGGSE